MLEQASRIKGSYFRPISVSSHAPTLCGDNLRSSVSAVYDFQEENISSTQPFLCGQSTMGQATLVPGDPIDFEAHHTGGDVVIWNQGPRSEALARPIDNTFVYQVVKDALKF